MPKKKYRALERLTKDDVPVMPGEVIELDSENVEILLRKHCIEEVENGTDDRSNELGELQDRTE